MRQNMQIAAGILTGAAMVTWLTIGIYRSVTTASATARAARERDSKVHAVVDLKRTAALAQPEIDREHASQAAKDAAHAANPQDHELKRLKPEDVAAVKR